MAVLLTAQTSYRLRSANKRNVSRVKQSGLLCRTPVRIWCTTRQGTT
jgi:hypothetical protein